jgi:hypothetical protein
VASGRFGTVVILIALISALPGIAAATLGYLNRQKITDNTNKTESIRVAVNGNLSTAIQRVDQLMATLHSAGVKVPNTPSQDTVIASKVITDTAEIAAALITEHEKEGPDATA